MRRKTFWKRRQTFDWRIFRSTRRKGWNALKAWWNRMRAQASGALKRRAVMARMHKADIILASPRTLRLSPFALLYRLVLRAQYIHSMLYLGDGRIVHTTTKDGVVTAPLPRKIFKRNRYTILRAKDLKSEDQECVVKAALQLKEYRLDYVGLLTNVPARLVGLRKPLLHLEHQRIWCSMLIYQAFLACGIELVPPLHCENVTSEDLCQSPLLQTI